MEVDLGGVSVNLLYFGPSHSDNLIQVHTNLDDVEIVLPGHGDITNQQNFRDSYRYIKALRDEVLAMMVDGKSLHEMRDLIQIEDFSDYRNLDRFLDANIVTMWEYLYHCREPNKRITPEEAVLCREDLDRCRTSNVNRMINWLLVFLHSGDDL